MKWQNIFPFVNIGVSNKKNRFGGDFMEKKNKKKKRTDAALPQHTYCDDKRGGRDRDACSKKTAGGDQAGNGAYPAVFRRGSKGGGSLSWDRKNITRADI